MDIYSLISYIFRGTVSLICAINLITIRLGATRKTYQYDIIHKCLASVAIIDAIVDTICVHWIINGDPYLDYTWLWCPKCYIEMTVMGVAILKPIRSPHRAWWFPPLLWYRILTDTPAFLRAVRNHLSGAAERSCYKLGRVAGPLYTIYLICAIIEMSNHNPTIDNIIMTINTAIVFISSLVVINFQPYSHQMKSLPHIIVGREQIDTDMSTGTGVRDSVEAWAHSPNHPWLADNVTLSDVARQINITPRLLSMYINNVYDTNFSAWINTLKVGTLRELIQRAPDTDSARLMTYCGFNSKENMSRVVKKVTGKTITELREESSLE